MVLGERRRRSVIAKLVELAIALLVVLAPASALALTRASVGENASALAALHAKTRVRGFELPPAEIASGFELSSARNASGKSARGSGERVRVHHSNRVWSPDLAAFLSPDEFGYVTKEGTLWSWPNQNPMRWRDPSGRNPFLLLLGGGFIVGSGSSSGASGLEDFSSFAIGLNFLGAAAVAEAISAGAGTALLAELGIGAGAKQAGPALLGALGGAVKSCSDGKSGQHLVLGLRAFGLEKTAAQLGGKTLLNDPNWRASLQAAIADPNTRFTVSLEGLSGTSTYSQVMSAVQNGMGPTATATNWELAQLYMAGRLGQVTFVSGGQTLSNPFQ